MKDNKSDYGTVIKLIAGLAVTVLIVAIFTVWFCRHEKRNDNCYSPDIVLMGDSIFATTVGEGSIADILGDKSGFTVCDESFGGTGACYMDTDARLDRNDDAYSLASLTQALITGDFRYQENSYPGSEVTWYFEDKIKELEKVDFSSVKILMIEHLLNDYHNGNPVNCGTDLHDEYTYEGALRSVITKLQKEYPQLRIILISPTRSWYGADLDQSSAQKDFGGGVITDYIECQKKIAEETGVEWISLYELYGDDSSNVFEYTIDGVHPNEAGNELIADYLYNYLNDNPDLLGD